MTEVEHYQGMSRGVVAALMTKLQSYDRKFTFEDADVLAFHDVAVQQRWTAHELDAAIRKWGATNTTDDWPSAAKIGALIRGDRQDRMSRAAGPGGRPPAAGAPGRAGIIQAWVEAAAGSKTRSQARRALVLKHEDLRQRLCASPLEFHRAEEWNGWIPPELTAEGARNTSPRRAALVEIVAEAERREAT